MVNQELAVRQLNGKLLATCVELEIMAEELACVPRLDDSDIAAELFRAVSQLHRARRRLYRLYESTCTYTCAPQTGVGPYAQVPIVPK